MVSVRLVPFLEDSNPCSTVVSFERKDRKLSMQLAERPSLRCLRVSRPRVESKDIARGNARIDLNRDSRSSMCVPDPHGAQEGPRDGARQNEFNGLLFWPEELMA